MCSLNAVWNEIKKLREGVNRINDIYKKESGYDFHLISEYSVEQMIKEARSQLVELAVKKTLEKYNIHNVSVSVEDKEKFEEGEFDEKCIENYIVKRYIGNADELAFKEIVSQARELLPALWDGIDRKELKVEDIVKNKKLVLRVYWNYEFLDWRCCGYINALDKLINIIIKGEKPSCVSAGMGDMVYSASTHSADFAQAKPYVYDNGVVKSLRIYKNGKLEVQFYREEDAKKVAEVLVSNNIDYDKVGARRH